MSDELKSAMEEQEQVTDDQGAERNPEKQEPVEFFVEQQPGEAEEEEFDEEFEPLVDPEESTNKDLDSLPEPLKEQLNVWQTQAQHNYDAAKAWQERAEALEAQARNAWQQQQPAQQQGRRVPGQFDPSEYDESSRPFIEHINSQAEVLDSLKHEIVGLKQNVTNDQSARQQADIESAVAQANTFDDKTVPLVSVEEVEKYRKANPTLSPNHIAMNLRNQKLKGLGSAGFGRMKRKPKPAANVRDMGRTGRPQLGAVKEPRTIEEINAMAAEYLSKGGGMNNG